MNRSLIGPHLRPLTAPIAAQPRSGPARHSFFVGCRAIIICGLAFVGGGQAFATGLIVVSGDSTPAFSLTDTGPDPALPGNDQFFSNILGAGQDVLVLNTTFSSSSFEINEFYASLAGKTSTLLTGTITAADLSGKELLVLSTPNDAFTPAEVSAIQDFSNSGGAIFAIGEGTAPGLTEANADINSLLTQLGSPLRLGTVDMDDGVQFATGSHIAADPLTAGVTSFRYGATVEVSGGTKLFSTQIGTPFVEYTIPEPSAAALLACTAFFGLAAKSRVRTP